jgi:UDP-glucose 4-epimerase
MRALVTGGCGFLGSALVRELKQRNYDVAVLDIDKSDPEDDVHYFQGNVLDSELLSRAMSGVDQIFHFAGTVGTTELLYKPNEAVEINISGTIRILDAARAQGVHKFLFPAMPAIWLNLYSITKYAAAEICRTYKQYFGLDVFVLRLLNAYGPGQHLYPVRKVVPIFILQALHDLPIEIWGTGKQQVEMVYSEDAARAAADFINLEKVDNRIFDSGVDIVCTVNELAELIRSTIGSKSSIIHMPMREGEDEGVRVPELQSFAVRPDTKPHVTPIHIGLERSISYYKSLPTDVIKNALSFYYDNNLEHSITRQAQRIKGVSI